MDIDVIINFMKSLPEDKRSEPETIKNVLQLAAKQVGKTYTEDQFLVMFQQFMQEDSQSKVISSLIKGGVSKKQLDSIKEKLDN